MATNYVMGDQYYSNQTTNNVYVKYGGVSGTGETTTYFYPWNTYPITTVNYPYQVEVKPTPAPTTLIDLEKEAMKADKESLSKENELLKKTVKRLLEVNYGEDKE